MSVCIVLDMDATLIGNKGDKVYPRPHLTKFLTFCFTNFKQVGIWTAAAPEWYEMVYKKIFHNILMKIKKNFSFVYTRERCRKLTKPLANIWQRKTWPWNEYQPHNTIIIDDNSDACSFNKSSAMIVPFYTPGDRDNVLKDLMMDLSTMIKQCKDGKDVRKVVPKRWKMR